MKQAAWMAAREVFSIESEAISGALNAIEEN